MHFQSEFFVFKFVPRSVDGALAVHGNTFSDHLLWCCKKCTVILFITRILLLKQTKKALAKVVSNNNFFRGMRETLLNL